MTALDIIKGAMRLIGVLAAGEVPRAEDAQDALLSLNAMINDWQNEPLIDAELSPYDSLAEDNPLQAGYEKALKYNLAVELAPEYGKAATIPALVVSEALNSKAKIKRAVIANREDLLECDDALLINEQNRGVYNISTDE